MGLLILVLTLIIPLITHGLPPFYGDDLHFISSLKSDGVLPGIKNWIDHYGIIYRPLGVSALYLIYYVTGTKFLASYLITFLFYFLYIITIYCSLFLLQNNSLLALFVTTFVTLFPLNPTAFLQLSSSYQILTAAFCVQFFYFYYLQSIELNFKTSAVLGILWFLLLLTYEQILGLTALFPVVFLFRVNPSCWNLNLLKKCVIHCAPIIILSVFYAVVYISAQGNPKIVTLKKLNNAVEAVSQSSDTTVEKKHEIKVENKSRLTALFSKLQKVRSFLCSNFLYALGNMKENPISIILFILCIIGLGAIILRSSSNIPSKNQLLSLGFFGLLWVLSTVAPFFLYREVHFPPYVLVIPSLGIALLTYSIYWLVFEKFGKKFSIYTFKFIFLCIVILFSLQQYGYFFGLKEELGYWQNVYKNMAPYKDTLIRGDFVTLNNLPRKNNQHIFWIEDAIGRRYFKNLLGDEFSALDLEFKNDRSTLVAILRSIQKPL